MNISLRSWRASDLNALVRLADNRKIWDNMRDHFPYPYTRKHALERIRLHGDEKPVRYFAIEGDGSLVGAITLIKKSDIERCTAELGYWIGEPFWGMGIASEAVRQIVSSAFDRDPFLHRIMAEVFAKNLPSQKVLLKNGFYLESVRKNAVFKNGILGDDTVWVKLREQ
jgi:RimJ/RimL family protein N-acetyltransferase